MADKTDNTEPEGTENQDPKQNEPSDEDKFWSRFDERLDAAIERGVKKHVPTRKPGTQRTEGRTTVPQVIADFMWGKQPK